MSRLGQIATSNLDLDLLTDGAQTSFQVVRRPAPANTIQMLALGSGGNVPAAHANLEAFYDAGA